MALSPFAIGDIFARAVRMIQDKSAEHRGFQMAVSIMNKMGLTPSQYGYTSDMGLHNAVWAVVKQAIASAASGLSVISGTPITPVPPRIPGIGPDKPNVVYRAVVRVRDPTGRTASTVVTLRFDTPTDYDTIRRLAAEMVANMTPREGDTPGKRRISEMTDYEVTGVTVILAGRRD